jgi:predicted TIM-barrel fold metal-dependent hydrolase
MSHNGIGLAALLVCVAGCSDPPLGVEVEGQRLAVVDMHLHPGEWELIPEATREFLASRFPFPFNGDPEGLASDILSAEGLVEQLDDAGVTFGVLMAVYSPNTVGIASNELVEADLAAVPDRFYGLASLRVDRWQSDEQAELERLATALAKPGMIGVKLAHAHMHFRMDDPAYDGIYVLASELGKPVYLHTGTSPFPGTATEPQYTDPAYLERAIAQHPDTIFILGHLGYDFFDQELEPGLSHSIALAQAYDNVYLEPSALGSKGSDPSGDNLREAMRRMRDEGVVDRIIYGSDGPQSPGFVRDYLERTVEAMQRADYSVDEMRAVLSGNFARVFGVTVPQP